jgi:hypothetical protein
MPFGMVFRSINWLGEAILCTLVIRMAKSILLVPIIHEELGPASEIPQCRRISTQEQVGFYEVMVGAEGFEPTTPASQTLCATRLRYAPTTV